MADALIAVAGGIAIVWGVAHIMPTRQVVAGFGDIGADNRWVITMEWVAEGLTFLFVGALIVAAAIVGDAEIAYWVSAPFLLVIGAWTAMTGARTGVI